MVAQRLYHDSSELEFQATVADIRLDSKDASGQLWQVALDRTAFYPAGGGQPWDTGVLIATSRSGAVLEVPVERVEEDHAQQHSGQHLLSAVFLNELGAKTVSFHPGAESVTIDLAMPEGKEKLTEDDLRQVEAAANRVVFQDRAIQPTWVEREEAEAMLARGDLRKLPERSGPMRIVEMEGVEFNACGGTHVASTGAIGSILIRKLEKVKQGQRVEFCCGLRAVKAARRDFEILRQLGATLSVGAVDVPDRVTKLLEDKKAVAKERKVLDSQLRTLQQELSQAQGDKLEK
jgi:alanyl-tRNA synthetase